MLRDPLERSNVDLEVVVSNLGEQFASYEGFLTAAKGADGNYHFFGRGLLGRLSTSSWTPGKAAAGRVGRRDRAAVGEEEGVEGLDGVDVTPALPSDSEEDRQRRRQEIRDRLRERREARRAERLGKPVSPVEEEPSLAVPGTTKGAAPEPTEEEPLPPEDEPVEGEPLPAEEEPPVE